MEPNQNQDQRIYQRGLNANEKRQISNLLAPENRVYVVRQPRQIAVEQPQAIGAANPIEVAAEQDLNAANPIEVAAEQDLNAAMNDLRVEENRQDNQTQMQPEVDIGVTEAPGADVGHHQVPLSSVSSRFFFSKSSMSYFPRLQSNEKIGAFVWVAAILFLGAKGVAYGIKTFRNWKK